MIFNFAGIGDSQQSSKTARFSINHRQNKYIHNMTVIIIIVTTEDNDSTIIYIT